MRGGPEGKKEGLMELLYVMNYIYENHEQYGYCIIQVKPGLKQFFGNTDYEKYVKDFFQNIVVED